MDNQETNVTQADALAFVDEAFRNMDMPAIGADAMCDISGALSSFLRRHRLATSPAIASGDGGQVDPLVDLIREWMMSTDHPVSKWECDFAAAIRVYVSAVQPDPSPLVLGRGLLGTFDEAPPPSGDVEARARALLAARLRHTKSVLAAGLSPTAECFGTIDEAIAALASKADVVEQLRVLIHESLYHLRLDDGAEAYHERALAAIRALGERDGGAK